MSLLTPRPLPHPPRRHPWVGHYWLQNKDLISQSWAHIKTRLFYINSLLKELALQLLSCSYICCGVQFFQSILLLYNFQKSLLLLFYYQMLIGSTSKNATNSWTTRGQFLVCFLLSKVYRNSSIHFRVRQCPTFLQEFEAAMLGERRHQQFQLTRNWPKGLATLTRPCHNRSTATPTPIVRSWVVATIIHRPLNLI